MKTTRVWFDKQKQYLYRYEDVCVGTGWDDCLEICTGYRVRLSLRRFPVIKWTPQGAWITLSEYLFEHPDDLYPREKKFVLLTARKKYACLNEYDAIESYIARKASQVKILAGQLERAKRALVVGEEQQKKFQEGVEKHPGICLIKRGVGLVHTTQGGSK